MAVAARYGAMHDWTMRASPTCCMSGVDAVRLVDVRNDPDIVDADPDSDAFIPPDIPTIFADGSSSPFRRVPGYDRGWGMSGRKRRESRHRSRKVWGRG